MGGDADEDDYDIINNIVDNKYDKYRMVDKIIRIIKFGYSHSISGKER